MSLPRDLVTRIRRLDQYQLRRLLILVRGLLIELDGAPTPEETGGRVRYRQRYVRCGRANCRRCPHGPYWYAYWREDGRTRSQYIGRYLPGQDLEPVVPDLER